MFISSTAAIVIVIFLIVVLCLVAWNLSHRLTPVPGPGSPCGTNQSCPTGLHCSNGICLIDGQCYTNNDCPGNNICVNGRCQVCDNDDQCPIGSVCESGRCSVMICHDEQDCPNGFFCNNQDRQITGVCHPNRCQDNSDCLNRQVCINHVCANYGNICSTNKDCQGGTLKCLNGRCQQCQNNSDCLSGSCLIQPLSFNGTTGATGTTGGINVGICTSGCHPNCPPGEHCLNNECVPDNDPLCGNRCTSSQQCGQGCPYCCGGICVNHKNDLGEYCQDDQGCKSGYCYGGRCQERGAECMLGDQSCPDEKPFCINGRCKVSAEGMICEPIVQEFTLENGESHSCPEGYHCVNGHCHSRKGYLGDYCHADDDCQSGLICEEETENTRNKKRCKRGRR